MLLNYIVNGDDKEIDINAMSDVFLPSRLSLFEQYSHLVSSEMTEDELNSLRPRIYREIARKAKKSCYFKVHEAFQKTSSGEFFFPLDVTQAAIYLIRNPLDVVPSLANHLNIDINEAIKCLGTDLILPINLSPDSIFTLVQHLPQRLNTWSGHVDSWTNQNDMPVCVIRYEDLLRQPHKELKRVAKAIGLSVSKEKINQAIEVCRFENLERQEQEKGFLERPSSCKKFFRKGQSNTWKESLTLDQASSIIFDNYKVMEKFGYIGGSMALKDDISSKKNPG
jgi:hypothetical protein